MARRSRVLAAFLAGMLDGARLDALDTSPATSAGSASWRPGGWIAGARRELQRDIYAH